MSSTPTTPADRAAGVVLSIASVRVLYSTERRAAEYDILVATIVECLAAGGRSADALIPAVQRVWPGTKVPEVNIVAALAAAETANLIHVSNGTYRLSEAGLREVDKSREWAEDVYRRTEEGLRERAARAQRAVTPEEARLWVGFISFALLNAISAATSAYKGDVNLRGDALVSPRSIDVAAIKKSLSHDGIAPEVQELLEAMVLEAIDPTIPFGNEPVSSITTGFLLQAFIARRDALHARNTLGSIANQTVVLDAPILFQLVAPPSRGSPLFTAIRTAVQSGCRVVICGHSFEELDQVRRRVERTNATQIAQATQNARTLAMYQRLAAEPFIGDYLLGFANGDFKNWRDFAAHCDSLPARLAGDGVEVIEPDLSPDDRADELFSRLGSTLAERPATARGRGFEEVRRDARTMAVAYRVRRERPTMGTWPSSWVVTTDTAMALAYRRFNKEDTAALTISPSQWVSILSVFSEPAGVEELAASGATILAQETMLRVAARYPAAAVAEIAEALAASSSEIEIRRAQLTLEDLLQEVPDLGADPKALGVAAAAKMLEQRSQHLEAKQARFAAEAAAEREALRREREALAQAKAQDDLKHQTQLEGAQQKIVEAESRATSEVERRREGEGAARRRLVQVAVTILLFAMAAIFSSIWLASDSFDELAGPLAAAFSISAVVFAATAESWVDGSHGPGRLLLALLPQLLAVPGLLTSLGIKLPWS